SSSAVISRSDQAPSEVESKRMGMGGIPLGWCAPERTSSCTIPGAFPKKHPSILYRLSDAVGVNTTLFVFPLTDRITGLRHGGFGSWENSWGFRESSPINSRVAALTGARVEDTASLASR